MKKMYISTKSCEYYEKDLYMNWLQQINKNDLSREVSLEFH